MVKHGRSKKPDADLDLELDEYEASDLDDDYDENEKVLLEKSANRNAKFDEDEDDSEEEVFRIHSSDDDEEDEDEGNQMDPVGEDMDSDIEGKGDDERDGLPSSKAWGTKRKNYYHTDYVDQDYGGFSKAEEEEAALLEEQEARAIQDRLVAELEETDFTFGLLTKVEDKEDKAENKKAADVDEVIKTDLSKLSKREKLGLLDRESPEFMGLVNDFKGRLTYAKDKLQPIISMVNSKEIPKCPATEFVSTKYHLTLNYCTNIAFYLLLKAKHINIQSHPVVKRLFQYRKLLEQMDAVDAETIEPQIDQILQNKKEGQMVSFDTEENKKRPEKRKKLKLLTSKDKEEAEVEIPTKKLKFAAKVEETPLEEIIGEDIEEDSNDEAEQAVEGSDAKRGITFQIAKNKGLTPNRKKEMRNPRVKNRNKFRRAKIRRKGQVREVRKETTRYGGEIFGIKASLSKSIKLK